ncbi:MAG: aldo/keto reductase [Planctomycetota bacterium]|jgi:predicted aldo/keto reductase-like oxidoreductase
MIYHTYGSTGIEVSAIGFGGMRFTNRDDIDTCASLVKAAYDNGINYFDTAPDYERSEEIFGRAFKQMNKTRAQKPFYVSTKSNKPEPEKIRKELETSLKKMNLDYIDFYHVWYVLSFDEYQNRKAKGAIAEFERLKEQGMVKHICISTHMTGPDIDKMLHDYPFEGILLGYSAMNFAYREAGLDAAAKLGLGVVVMNPLGGGLIPQNPERFAFVKTRPAETVVEGALRFLINDPRITTALVGLSSHDQLAEAISAVDGLKPVPAPAIDKIRAGLEDSFNQLCTVCRYCDDCPQGIDVPRMMDVYNRRVLKSEDPIEMINQLRWHWGIALEDNYLDKCTECGQCEQACTQKLPIVERLKVIRDEVEKYLTAEKAKKQQ